MMGRCFGVTSAKDGRGTGPGMAHGTVKHLPIMQFAGTLSTIGWSLSWGLRNLLEIAASIRTRIVNDRSVEVPVTYFSRLLQGQVLTAMNWGSRDLPAFSS